MGIPSWITKEIATNTSLWRFCFYSSSVFQSLFRLPIPGSKGNIYLHKKHYSDPSTHKIERKTPIIITKQLLN